MSNEEMPEMFDDKSLKEEMLAKQITDALAEGEKLTEGEVAKEGIKQEVPEEVGRVYTDIEVEQMDRGWDPNKEDGVSAKEFKRVGEIIEAKRKASKEAYTKSKEVEELTMTVKQLVEHNKAMAQLAHKQALQQLDLKKMEKIQEGDVDGVFKIDNERAALQEAARQTLQVPQQEQQPTQDSEAVSAFKTKYKDALMGTTKEDKKVQALVKAQVQYYMENDPNIDEKLAISEIEEMLSKNYPERFMDKVAKTTSKVAVSTVTTKGASTDVSSKMSLEDKVLFEQIKAADPTFKLDDFAKLYLNGKNK